MKSRYAGKVVLAALLAAVTAPRPAVAHPHVWVEVETTIIHEHGSFTGIEQRWTFDEFYTTSAIEGLDTNKDGRLDRQELSELARVNMEGLKEFGYFTVATLAGQRLDFGEPTSFHLDYIEVTTVPGPRPEGADTAANETKPQDGFWSRAWKSLLGQDTKGADKPRVLALSFRLPLSQPVLAEAEDFEVQTADPSFFIWFELARQNPARFSEGAPSACKTFVAEPSKAGADMQRLGEAFATQLNAAGGVSALAKTISASCRTP